MSISRLPLPSRQRRVDLFTASGTWTCPTGVTYAVAFIRAGGGGGGGHSSGSTGGSSSALGTTAGGGTGGTQSTSAAFSGNEASGNSAASNSGEGGHGRGWLATSTTQALGSTGSKGTELYVGSSVTPGTGYTITVGSGGSGGTYAGSGGSGVVWIEYEVEA